MTRTFTFANSIDADTVLGYINGKPYTVADALTKIILGEKVLVEIVHISSGTFHPNYPHVHNEQDKDICKLVTTYSPQGPTVTRRTWSLPI